jgi:hypothetical protein
MVTKNSKSKLKTALSHSVNSVRILACLFLIGMAILQYLYNKYLPSFHNPADQKKEIRHAIKKQLGYVRRNIKNINLLLDQYERIPFDDRQYTYFL